MKGMPVSLSYKGLPSLGELSEFSSESSLTISSMYFLPLRPSIILLAWPFVAIDIHQCLNHMHETLLQPSSTTSSNSPADGDWNEYLSEGDYIVDVTSRQR